MSFCLLLNICASISKYSGTITVPCPTIEHCLACYSNNEARSCWTCEKDYYPSSIRQYVILKLHFTSFRSFLKSRYWHALRSTKRSTQTFLVMLYNLTQHSDDCLYRVTRN